MERQSRDHVLGRIRAGVLEQGLCDMLRDSGLGARMDKEGQIHEGFNIAYDNRLLHINLRELTGRTVMVYGQTEITRDLYAASDAGHVQIVHNVEEVQLHNLDGKQPKVSWRRDGKSYHCVCDYVAGCDGYHGVSRRHIPAADRRIFERVHPFGWLGVLSPTPPVRNELIYARHARGFALCSMRGPMLSRYYLQCAADEKLEEWPDERFWRELKMRLPAAVAADLTVGGSVEKSIAPLRSFVVEPMRWGRLFLAGDAAHIVPPTGAKGLNLAASDVYYLSRALIDHYRHNDDAGLKSYSATALARVWKAERFSWAMTAMLHQFSNVDDFDGRLQRAELDYLAASHWARAALAENYAGLPY